MLVFVYYKTFIIVAVRCCKFLWISLQESMNQRTVTTDTQCAMHMLSMEVILIISLIWEISLCYFNVNVIAIGISTAA